MNKTSIVILGLMALFSSVHLSAREFQGMSIIGADTSYVTFDIPVKGPAEAINLRKIQFSINVMDTLGQLTKLLPGQVDEIQIWSEDTHYRLISVANNLGLGGISGKANIFLLLTQDGRIRVFEYFHKDVQHPRTYLRPRWKWDENMSVILLKAGGELVRPQKLGFRTVMSTLVGDCPEVLERLKEFEFYQMRKLVSEYNANCGRVEEE